MTFYAFVETPSGPPLMEWLRSTETAAALSEARALPGPQGQIVHVFEGNKFVQTLSMSGRTAGVAGGCLGGQAGDMQTEPISPPFPTLVDPAVSRGRRARPASSPIRDLI